MSLPEIDSKSHSLIDSFNLEDFLKLSEHMELMQNKLNGWFAHEDKMKECRSSNHYDFIHTLHEAMKAKKENDFQKTQEEKETLQKLEVEISKIERRINTNDQAQLIAEKKHEKQKLEQLYHQNKLDRLKDILLFDKESRYYIAAIYDLRKYQIFMSKLRTSIETSYEEYHDADYDTLVNEIEHPLECYICPRCSTEIYDEPYELYNLYGIPLIHCTSCHLEFCPKCDRTIEEHDYDPNYPCCYGIYHEYRPKSLAKCNLFTVWPMDYETRKQYSAWHQLYDQYVQQKEKYEALYSKFLLQKDEKPKDGSTVISLSKLCIRSRVARVLLRETTDREKVKNETLKMLNTVLSAQSIITLAYPALFYIIDNQEKTDSLNEVLHDLEEATNAFIEILYHPEHSSTEEMNQNVETLQQLMNAISIL